MTNFYTEFDFLIGYFAETRNSEHDFVKQMNHVISNQIEFHKKMAKFEAIELSSEEIRSAFYMNFIEKRFKSENYQLVVSLASKSGTNIFIGIVYRAELFSNADPNSEETLTRRIHSLIVKLAPQKSEQREFLTLIN